MQVLHARHADVRGQTFQQVLSEGDAYLRDTKVRAIKVSKVWQRDRGLKILITYIWFDIICTTS